MTTLINNASILAILIVLIYFVSLKYKKIQEMAAIKRNILVGLAFGLISIMGIAISHRVFHGFIDGKFAILLLVTLFFGAVPAAICGSVTFLYLILFASGYTGTVNFLLSASFAILVPTLYKAYIHRRGLAIALSHLVLLSIAVASFAILLGIAQAGSKSIAQQFGVAGSISLLFVFVFTYILSRAFLFEIERQEKEQSLHDKNLELDHANQELKSLNISLAAAENQMRAQNEQLIAAESQMRAQNEQLIAAESQMRAQNEQLAAADEEMKAQFEELVFSKAKIEEDENILRMILSAGQEAIWYYQVDDHSWHLSDQAYGLLDYAPGEIDLHESAESIIHPDDLDEYVKADEALKNRAISSYQIEYRALAKDGSYRWLSKQATAQFDANHNLVRVAGALSSIQERKEKEQELYRLVYYDYLTGLPNRAYYAEAFRDAITACGTDYKLALIYLDIDNLKKVNVSKGHALGDQLLINTANILKEALGSDSVLCRMGGDEFAVIMKENAGNDTLESRVESIIDLISTPYIINETTFQMECCVGIAIYPNDGATFEELLKHADNALLRAKKIGKNRYLFFNTEMRKEAEERLELESLLITALQNDEIDVHYQPIVESGTGQVRKVEALMRWRSAKLGNVSPVKFIPILEETGQIVQFGNHLMRQACLLNSRWNDHYNADIITAINISPFQLMQPDFSDKVNRIIAETGIRPEHLELEITESIFISDFKTIKGEIDELRTLGIKISLDDFGTGYSSLNYLRSLNINTLKIDKSFVDDLLSSDNTSIIGSIISLAHDMGLQVVAEGVEKAEQKELLESKHCDFFQGYYFYKPLPGEELTALLEGNKV